MNGDGTHNKKQFHFIYNKGMIPIEKNIIVVDEQGNEYEATYPKRAKGLVKNGRARFIDENTICLACPPNTKMEDNNMSENIKINPTNNNTSNSKTTKEVTETTAVSPTPTTNQSSEKLTMDYLLGKLEEISLGQAFLTDAISELGKMKSGGPGDVGTQEQAKAIGEIIKAREATNQKLIALYEKMYDDLKPDKKINNERVAVIGTLIETLGEGLTPVESKEALTEILGIALQDLTKNI